MKKTIFAISLMASLLAGAAKADSYLYWMVDVNEAGWTYDYSVKVKDDTGSYLSLYFENDPQAYDSIGKASLQSYEGSGLGFYAKLASDPTYTSYVFELWSDTEMVADSGSKSYTDVQAYITGSGLQPPVLGPLPLQMTLPAPEPSSGLLLLLGVAGLALRRRKQVAA